MPARKNKPGKFRTPMVQDTAAIESRNPRRHTGIQKPSPNNAGGIRPTTAPYTFVPFAPTVTAAQLWPSGDETPDVDPTRSFDRLLPSAHTGHIDLTITALTPLHVGQCTDKHPFRWPVDNGRHAIPAFSLRGMLRAELATVLGGALGLPAELDIPVLERHPVRGKDGDVAQIRHNAYLQRRGASAKVGKQRVGLLDWDGKSDTAYVRECPQQQLGNRRKVPSAQWRVVREDLLGGASGDVRDVLRALRGTRVHVVCARVRVNAIPRPVVFAIGRDESTARANATARLACGQSAIQIVAPPPKKGYGEHTFDHYLDARRSQIDTPVAQPLTFFPTNLSNLDANGVATSRANESNGEVTHVARNCYLLADPGTALSASAKDTYHGAHAPIRVNGDTLKTLELTLRQPYWTGFPTPADLHGKGGWPIFFDAENGEVTFLGGSGGFPIRATHTVAEAVANGGGTWAGKIGTPVQTNDAVIALLGAIDGDQQIAARIGVGHATATTGVTPLAALPVVLLSPNPQSAHTRLSPDGGNHETGTTATAHTPSIDYSNNTPKYRGRERYWHHWPTDGTDGGAQQWRTAVESHHALTAEVTDNTQDPHEGDETSTTLAPLPIGTTFTARLTFTNLTDAELGALLFVLRFPTTNNESGHPFAHKLGGGQSLGLGSVAITADLFRHTPDRYLSLTEDGIVADDGTEFITAFRCAVGWTSEKADATWHHDRVTNQSWPEHVAAWLTAARWNTRPDPAATAEMGVSGHRAKIPMLGVFEIGG
ncbi:hypothetical protein [Nocardia sp. NPDC058705]|uniref:hypothetical protein n=1 Tax=Nocardia sp. NPDC058705 TaxID=3346609 RepID=UPI003683BC5C